MYKNLLCRKQIEYTMYSISELWAKFPFIRSTLRISARTLFISLSFLKFKCHQKGSDKLSHSARKRTSHLCFFLFSFGFEIMQIRQLMLWIEDTTTTSRCVSRKNLVVPCFLTILSFDHSFPLWLQDD